MPSGVLYKHIFQGGTPEGASSMKSGQVLYSLFSSSKITAVDTVWPQLVHSKSA